MTTLRLRRSGTVLLPLGLLIILVSVHIGAGQAFAEEPPPRFEPRFEHSSCPDNLGVPGDVALTCGFVTVLENRAILRGSTIDLYVVRIEGKSRFLNRDPIIYLAGGPGGSATRAAQWFIDDARFLYTDRDLVLFDQRGIGGSKPRLECPEFRHRNAELRHLDLSPEEKLQRRVDALLDCRKSLSAEQGIDVDTYNSASTAADVVDIASAMGYDSYNLYGSSYGTILALTVMRDFPANIRSVVLDGVLPLQVNHYHSIYSNAAATLEKLFLQCEADPECSQRYPDLEETFWSAVERYTADPFTLRYYDRYADDIFEEEFDGNFVVGRAVSSLRSERWIPYVPVLISEIADGNVVVADGWARPVYRVVNEPIDNTAAGISMACYSFGPTMDDAKLARDREAHSRFVDPDILFTEPAICDEWLKAPVDPIEDEPVVSDIPTLLLSGQFDPATPSRWADLAAETLSNSFSFVLPMTGHGVGINTSCGRTLTEKFLESPTTNPVSPCTVESGTGFSDMYLNRGLRTMDSWHFDSVNPPIPEGLESWLNRAHLYVTVSVLFLWPLLFLFGLLRQGPYSVMSRAWLARFIAAAALFATWGFTRWILDNGELTDDLVRNFGYFSRVRPWFIVPYLVWAATALVLYLTLRAWWERWWSVLGRIHYTLVVLALAWWIERLVRWDFIGL
ncbi:MAG: alpha/beta hydrolase [Dehalococcoidia bacterium]|nr:alpha/beta hydrolase [Dehalococcoidia bacterium]